MRWLRPGFRGFSGISSMLKLETFLLLQFFSSYPERLMKRQERINPFLYAKTFINRNVSYQIHPMYSMENDDSIYEWWEVVPRILPCCSFMELPYTTLPSISTLWYYTTLNALFHQIACSLINTSPPWWSKLKAKIMMTAQFNCKVRWTLAQIRLDTKIKQVKKKKKKKKSRNIYLKKALLNSYLLQTRHH